MVWPADGDPAGLPTPRRRPGRREGPEAKKATAKVGRPRRPRRPSTAAPSALPGWSWPLLAVGGLIAYVLWPPGEAYLYRHAEALMESPSRTDWIAGQATIHRAARPPVPRPPLQGADRGLARPDRPAPRTPSGRAEVLREAGRRRLERAEDRGEICLRRLPRGRRPTLEDAATTDAAAAGRRWPPARERRSPSASRRAGYAPARKHAAATRPSATGWPTGPTIAEAIAMIEEADAVGPTAQAGNARSVAREPSRRRTSTRPLRARSADLAAGARSRPRTAEAPTLDDARGRLARAETARRPRADADRPGIGSWTSGVKFNESLGDRDRRLD